VFGVKRRKVASFEEPVNIAASELMGELHDALQEAGYRGHDLERLLVRLLFCLFADDTGIFEPKDLFQDLIEQRTSEDGSNIGQWLMQLFEVLNEPETERQTNLDEDLQAFPYVNGDLFVERLRIPAFTKEMRAVLLRACAFKWDAVSPAIFGALFQSVMDREHRRAQGAHYTTERNILKVIEPLFLDELRAEFQRLREQREQVRRIAGLGGSGGTLDYVTAWFLKAGDYARAGKARVGFVATNSITQGEQVAQLWPLLFQRCGLEIAFAHSTFAWGSDARGMAHVHVVILGLTRREDEPRAKRLFTYADIKGDPVESVHAKLSPYLIDAANLSDPHLVVSEASRPQNGLPQLIIGSKPIDGGHLIFTPEERDAFLHLEPEAAPFLRPYIGAEELINGSIRYILALHEATPAELRRLPCVLERLERVRQHRLKSKSAPTNGLAATPALYHVNVLPTRPFLAIPEVSSERREYAPIAYLEPPIVPSNLLRVLPDVSLWLFGLLTSRMHMAWLRAIGGRLKSDYR
jgi:hypothetical protein